MEVRGTNARNLLGWGNIGQQLVDDLGHVAKGQAGGDGRLLWQPQS